LILGLFWTYYLNLSDGTKNYPLELRDRDDFYLYFIIFFYFTAGIGITKIIDLLIKKIHYQILSVTILILITILIPFQIIGYNGMFLRSNDKTAEQFASDIINSCPENTILFTNGDNDTYPLWAIKKMKKDGLTNPIIINLSLLNSISYVQEIAKKISLPISEQEIKDIFQIYPRIKSTPFPMIIGNREIQIRGKKIHTSDSLTLLTPSHVTSLRIINYFADKKNIAFCMTIPQGDIPFEMESLNSYGFILLWDKDYPIKEKIKKGFSYIEDWDTQVFRIKNIHKLDNATQMIYNNLSIILLQTYEKALEFDSKFADEFKKRIIASPYYSNQIIFTAFLKESLKNKDFPEAGKILKHIDSIDEWIYDEHIYYSISEILFHYDIKTGLKYLKKALIMNPWNMRYYRLLYKNGRTGKEKEMILKYAEHYLPADSLSTIKEGLIP